jgi:hypothetical protein
MPIAPVPEPDSTIVLTRASVQADQSGPGAIQRNAKILDDADQTARARLQERRQREEFVDREEIAQLREDIRHGGKPGVIYAFTFERKQFIRDAGDRLIRLTKDFRQKYGENP